MLPFFVHTDEIAPRLYELSDGRFQIVEKGELTPFMSGYGYVLVRPDLAEFLEQLEIERVTIEDAIVWDRASNTECKTYKRLRLNHHFTSDQIKDINVEGIKLLVMDNELVFASPMLTASLKKSHFTYLKFSEGLDGFAAQI
jgi:hypothetical protein